MQNYIFGQRMLVEKYTLLDCKKNVMFSFSHYLYNLAGVHILKQLLPI